MAKIVTRKAKKADEKNEEKMQSAQRRKLAGDEEGAEKEASKGAEKNPEVEITASSEADQEISEEALAESRPKTAHDQIKVLGVDQTTSGPVQTALLASAKAKIEANEKGGDEELSEEELEAYMEEERYNLKKYGKVKLTPVNRNVERHGVLRKDSPKEGGDLVKVTMFETIDPAPTVGHVSVPHQFNHTSLQKGETYLLPKVVAAVIAEGKKGAIHD